MAGSSTNMELASLGVLTGFTSKTVGKMVAALALSDRQYAVEILPGLVLMVACAWGAFVVQQVSP